MKKLKLTITTLVLGLSLFVPATVLAQTKTAICEGVGKTSGSAGCAGDSSLDGIIATVINIMSMVVGVIAVIMIIIGGIKYVTSSGDSNNVNSAKNTILYAIVGLVVVALAQVIVRFVLGKV
jgi:hypothetical protein